MESLLSFGRNGLFGSNSNSSATGNALNSSATPMLNTFVTNALPFRGVEPGLLPSIVQAFAPISHAANKIVVSEGTRAPALYYVEKGECIGYKTDVATRQKQVLQRFSSGGSFGETALMHGGQFEMTVETESDCVIWVLEKSKYDAIIARKANFNAELISRIKTFSALRKEDIDKLANVLVEMRHQDGDVIMRQGDRGDKFCILLEGVAVAYQDQRETVTYSQGQFFGERSLLLLKPRAATVVSKGASVTGAISVDNFNLLLAPCRDAMLQHIQIMKYCDPKSMGGGAQQQQQQRSQPKSAALDPLDFVDRLLDGDPNDRHGVGLILKENPETRLIQVASVVPGESADSSRQIAPGDTILGIDGKKGLSLDDANAALLGPAGSVVSLHLLRSDAVEAIVPLMRGSSSYFDSLEYKNLVSKAQQFSDDPMTQRNLAPAPPPPSMNPRDQPLPISQTLTSPQMNNNEYAASLPFVLPIALPKKEPSTTVVSTLNGPTEAEKRKAYLEQRQLEAPIRSFVPTRMEPLPPVTQRPILQSTVAPTIEAQQTQEASLPSMNRQWFSVGGDGKVGVGIVVENDPISHNVYVQNIIQDAGADRSGGVAVGDTILSVDGIQVDGLPSTLFRMIRGVAGTFVDVEFGKDGNSKKRIVRLQRGTPEYFQSKQHFDSLRTDDEIRYEIGILHKKMTRYVQLHAENRDKVKQTQELIQSQHREFSVWAQPLIQRNEKAAANIKILETEYQRIHNELQYVQGENRLRREKVAELLAAVREEETSYNRVVGPSSESEANFNSQQSRLSWKDPSTWGSVFAI